MVINLLLPINNLLVSKRLVNLSNVFRWIDVRDTVSPNFALFIIFANIDEITWYTLKFYDH